MAGAGRRVGGDSRINGDGDPREECARCRERLAAYRERLHLVRHELDRLRTRLESQTLRLDGVIGDLDLFLEATQELSRIGGRPQRIPRIRTGARHDMTLSVVKAVERSDGHWDIQLDTLPTFELPPLLGRLFVLLAEDRRGHDIGDGSVAFKAPADLIAELNRPLASADSKLRRAVGRQNAKGLPQAVYEIRQRLKRIVVGNVLQTRRGHGWRIAVLKSGAPHRR